MFIFQIFHGLFFSTLDTSRDEEEIPNFPRRVPANWGRGGRGRALLPAPPNLGVPEFVISLHLGSFSCIWGVIFLHFLGPFPAFLGNFPTFWGNFPTFLGHSPAFWGHFPAFWVIFLHLSGLFSCILGHFPSSFLGGFPAIFLNFFVIFCIFGSFSCIFGCFFLHF